MADLVATTGTAVSLCAGVGLGLTFINIQSVVTDQSSPRPPVCLAQRNCAFETILRRRSDQFPAKFHRYYCLEQILTFV